MFIEYASFILYIPFVAICLLSSLDDIISYSYMIYISYNMVHDTQYIIYQIIWSAYHIRYMIKFLIWEVVHVAKNSQRSFLSLESRHITGQVSKSPKMSDRPQNSDVAENKENTYTPDRALRSYSSDWAPGS